MLLGVVADRVFMAAEDVDGVAADAQARAGNQACVDGVADGSVGGAGAFGSHIAFGGEASHQIVTGGERRHHGALGHRFLNGLQVFGAGMEKEVYVRVDQAGQQRGVAEVDDFGAGRMLYRRADFYYNPVALNEDFSRLDEAAGFHVKHAGGVQTCGARDFSRSLGCSDLAQTNQAEEKRDRAVFRHVARDGTTPFGSPPTARNGGKLTGSASGHRRGDQIPHPPAQNAGRVGHPEVNL